ncbi:hypothetical protein HanPI659440_Chr05g0207031 [Helianthus annuus]|nr:hypothetical protein HanPI659440_Chr05g0207031 [Helianthus annuus]
MEGKIPTTSSLESKDGGSKRKRMKFVGVCLSSEVLLPKYIRHTLNWRFKSPVSNQNLRCASN